MRYLLVTGHRYPNFYKVDGSVLEIDLNYADSKVIFEIDEAGNIVHQKLSGTPPCVGNVWMVDSIEESLHRLEANDVYPFKNKSAAREHAKRLELSSFKYIPVP